MEPGGGELVQKYLRAVKAFIGRAAKSTPLCFAHPFPNHLEIASHSRQV